MCGLKLLQDDSKKILWSQLDTDLKLNLQNYIFAANLWHGNN